MKALTLSVSAVTFSFFVVLFVRAQDTLYLSTLGNPTSGASPVGHDSWIGQSFVTGTNSDGYILDSIQLLMSAASGPASGFSVSLYDFFGQYPQDNLGTLNGSSDPVSAGLYTFTTSGLTLSASTPYCVVVTASTTVAQGAFNWNAESSPVGNPSSQGWFWGLYYDSNDGLNWSYHRGLIYQLGVYGTPIPEPSTFALMSLGGVFLLLCRSGLKRGSG
ncbi:MAG TPA: PEP-CTERM sorting domain-containing protein [Candidatus Acidoferrum sp.]|nr:PEP-CTERM sorting domain-containing protein [Candidatus Acidoferrum sp.]